MRIFLKGLALTLTLWISVTVILSVIAAPFSPLGTPTAGEYSAPAGGAGRDGSRGNEGKTHDAEEPCKLQSSKISLVVREETASGEGARQVTVKLKGTSSTAAGGPPSPLNAGKAQEAGKAEEAGTSSVTAAPCHLPHQGEGSELDGMIRAAAERYGLPWELVSAVVWAESRYDPNAKSDTPDYGLMQITENVLGAYGLNENNRYDPAANLDAGCRILKEKLDASGGDFTTALMRYREGDGGARELWAAGIWSTPYTEAVLGRYYEILRGEG